MLLIILAVAPLLQTLQANSLSEETDVIESYAKYREICTFIPLETNNYVGAFVRGEDVVNISGSLVTENGEPVGDADIYVYLNTTSDDIFVGTSKTDAQGRFNVIIDLSTSIPTGNLTVTIYFPGDISRGLSPAYDYYWILVYGKIFVEAMLSNNRLALFDENVTISTWAVLDNGSLIRRSNLTFDLEVITGDIITYSATILSDNTGIAREIIPFNSSGDYSVIVTLNTSLENNNIDRWIIAQYQYIENNSVRGPSISNITKSFEVYLATKIKLSFYGTNEKTYYADRSGETVEIVGRFYNVTGDPSSASLNLTIWYANNSLYKDITVVTNASGFFKFSLQVNATYDPGRYIIRCNDLDPITTDLSDILYLVVISHISIIIDEVNPDLNRTVIKSGTNVLIKGKVMDSIDNRPLGGATIRAELNYYTDRSERLTLNETNTNHTGDFVIHIKLPEMIPSKNGSIIIVASVSNFYTESDIAIPIEVYNYIQLNVAINRTTYAWIIEDGSAFALTDPVLRNITMPAILRINISIYDDFYRTWNVSNILVYFNSSLVYEGYNTSNVIFELNVTFTGELTIIVEELNVNISIHIEEREIITRSSEGRFWEIIPLDILLIFVASFLVIATISGAFRMHYIKKTTVMHIDSIGILSNIEKHLAERKIDKSVKLIREFLFQLAKELEYSPPASTTLRELLLHLLNSKRNVIKNIIKELEYLIYVYEKLVYGRKKLYEREIEQLEQVISNLSLFLKSYKRRREES